MKFTGLMIALLLPVVLKAQDSVEVVPWQELDQVGEARLNFYFWPVYNASLYSNTPVFNFPTTRPFALQLDYLRAFTRQQFVEETRRQWQDMDDTRDVAADKSRHDAWLDQLEQILRDVNKTDTITLYVDKAGSSTFYLNETLLGSINDSVFTERFAAIWLSEETTRPGFRKSLLGLDIKEK